MTKPLVVYQKPVAKYLNKIQSFLRNPHSAMDRQPGAVSETTAWLHDILFPIARCPGSWDHLTSLAREMRDYLDSNADYCEVDSLLRRAESLLGDTPYGFKIAFDTLTVSIRRNVDSSVTFDPMNAGNDFVFTSSQWGWYLFISTIASLSAHEIMTLRSAFDAYIAPDDTDPFEIEQAVQLRLSVVCAVFDHAPPAVAPVDQATALMDRDARVALMIRLDELTSKAGLDSMRDIAAHTGISLGTINGICKGKVMPRKSNRRKLAEAFGLPPEELSTHNLLDWARKNPRLMSMYTLAPSRTEAVSFAGG